MVLLVLPLHKEGSIYSMGSSSDQDDSTNAPGPKPVVDIFELGSLLDKP